MQWLVIDSTAKLVTGSIPVLTYRHIDECFG